MTVLLWGLPTERPLAAVRAELDRLGAAVVVLDQRGIDETDVDLDVGAEVRGVIRGPCGTIDLQAVDAAYLRPYGPEHPPAGTAAADGAAWMHGLRVAEALYTWAEIAPALVVNRPEASAANGSKPYQAALIRRHGFAVPETLITTEPEAAGAFWETHGAVVYKSVSGVRSVVRRLESADAARLADVTACPTQFQVYVPGTDYRVHVAGPEVFACAIETSADDYRYPGAQPLCVRPAVLPENVDERCRAITAALGLAVAGVDLRRTPEGVWYCFEVNPSPAFTYYEQWTDQPIGRAIARLLARGPIEESATALASPTPRPGSDSVADRPRMAAVGDPEGSSDPGRPGPR